MGLSHFSDKQLRCMVEINGITSPGKSPRWEQLGDVQLQKVAYLIACIIID
jgi:hypothetical protein